MKNSPGESPKKLGLVDLAPALPVEGLRACRKALKQVRDRSYVVGSTPKTDATLGNVVCKVVSRAVDQLRSTIDLDNRPGWGPRQIVNLVLSWVLSGLMYLVRIDYKVDPLKRWTPTLHPLDKLAAFVDEDVLWLIGVLWDAKVERPRELGKLRRELGLRRLLYSLERADLDHALRQHLPDAVEVVRTGTGYVLAAASLEAAEDAARLLRQVVHDVHMEAWYGQDSPWRIDLCGMSLGFRPIDQDGWDGTTPEHADAEGWRAFEPHVGPRDARMVAIEQRVEDLVGVPQKGSPYQPVGILPMDAQKERVYTAHRVRVGTGKYYAQCEDRTALDQLLSVTLIEVGKAALTAGILRAPPPKDSGSEQVPTGPAGAIQTTSAERTDAETEQPQCLQEGDGAQSWLPWEGPEQTLMRAGLAADVNQAELDMIVGLLEVGRNILRKKLKRAQKRRYSARREQILCELADDGWIPVLAAAIKAEQYRFHRFRKGIKDKPGGGTRVISRQMVHWDRVIDLGLGQLLANLIEPLLLPCCIGYRRGTSATPFLLDLHDRIRQGQNYRSLDIKGFFPSVDAHRLRCMIGRLDLPDCLKKLLIRLVLGRRYRDGEDIVGLPQGLACSPPISNVYLTPLDRKLTKDLDPRVLYGRYSDNLVLAAPECSLDGVVDLINRVLQQQGMELKETNRHEVLGFNANSDGLTVPTNKITAIWHTTLEYLCQDDTKAAQAAWCGWHNHHSIANGCRKLAIAVAGYHHILRHGSYPNNQLDALRSLPI